MVVNPYRNSGIRTPYAQGSAIVGGKSASCSCIPTRWLILILVISITVISYVFHIYHGLALTPKHEDPSPKLRGDQLHLRKSRMGMHTKTSTPPKLPVAPDEDKSHRLHIDNDKATAPPSLKPSPSPTSEEPTQGPTPPPRVWPTILPTPLPTIPPTIAPSVAPTAVPTVVPTISPTLKATNQVSQVTATTIPDPPAIVAVSSTDKPDIPQPVASAVPLAAKSTNPEETQIVNHNQPPPLPQPTPVEETANITNKIANLMPLELVEGEISKVRPWSDSKLEHILTSPKEVPAVANQQSLIAPPPASATVDAAPDLSVPNPAAIDASTVQPPPPLPDGEQMINAEEEAAGDVKRTDLADANELREEQPQRSRFDLPASVKVIYPGRPSTIKGSSATGNSTSNANGSKQKVDYCQGHIDPFEEQSIENFTPPPSATFDKVVEWKSTVKETLKGIGKLQIGGEKLRKIMEQEVDKLKILRFRLFCEYAT